MQPQYRMPSGTAKHDAIRALEKLSAVKYTAAQSRVLIDGKVMCCEIQCQRRARRRTRPCADAEQLRVKPRAGKGASVARDAAQSRLLKVGKGHVL